MKKLLTAVAATALAAGMILPVQAQAPTKIKISYQPALYWALPFFVATEKGWWKDIGLEPEFSTFPAGAPQVAAAQAKSWDVGGTGSVPAVLGAARFGLLTIGLTNDESKANAMMVRAEKLDALKANPASIKGQKILITTNSTVHYASLSCLKKWGVAASDVEFVNLGQAQIISAITSSNGDIAGVWAPNTYTLEEKASAKYLCSGADADAIVPGALVARSEFVKENPQAVAKFLAVYLRGWSWAKANPVEARALMKKFYAVGGVEISDKAADAEFGTRPVYSLDEQLKIMDRASGKSQVDTWLGNIATFMIDVGTIPKAPDVNSYVDNSAMQLVKKDPALAAFAAKTN